MRRRTPPCDHPGQHGLKRPRLYPAGWRCDRHTPAALAGRPEAPPGPGWPPGSYLNARKPEPPATAPE
ncbi:hypothetical protein [Streptomyces sp. NPDC006477]|uniref:hypothetical protein n=1 Tax=Streptomyces sp. NPDC006477 TaxID=3364747 RepID=UPI00368C3E90